jgi:hypothetical protein
MFFNRGRLQLKERGKTVAHHQVESFMSLGVAQHLGVVMAFYLKTRMRGSTKA